MVDILWNKRLPYKQFILYWETPNPTHDSSWKTSDDVDDWRLGRAANLNCLLLLLPRCGAGNNRKGDYAIRNGRCGVMLPNEKEPWLIDKCAKWKSWTELPSWFWRNIKGGVQLGLKIVTKFWIILATQFPENDHILLTTLSTLPFFSHCFALEIAPGINNPFLLTSMDFVKHKQA